MTEFTNQEKAQCAEREYNMRKHVYPRWVQQGKMTQKKADYELAVMEAIAQDYVYLAGNTRLL